MRSMTENGGGQPAKADPIDVRSEVARTLIAAMEAGATPWQKPWAAAALKPVNATTGNAYRGANRLLLALAAKTDADGRADPRWATYQQAKANGWQVRRGEKGTPIVKVVELPRTDARELGAGGATGSGANVVGGKDVPDQERKAFTLRRYMIFNAQQMDGPPQLEAPAPLDFNPVERADAVMQALMEKTGLLVVHGGDQACYVRALDEVRLPPKKSFASAYDYYATALHEGAHSTLHKKRMDRQEAIAKRWGDQAYALEELRAEICSAILAAETGVPMGQVHVENHAAYLRHWLDAVAQDPMALFSAAKDAERMAEYMLGLEKQMGALEVHKDWIHDYEQAMER